MEQTFRWYGPNDPVQLSDIRQAGATGVVSALHHIPCGQVWPVGAILERKKIIEDAGLTWSVVESIPVHEQIKFGGPDRDRYIVTYQESIQNLGACGIDTLCYNFMPVVDWTRTDLDFEWEDGSSALRFDLIDFVAFDVHILKRPNAENDYTSAQLAEAQEALDKMSEQKRKQLTYNIIRGLPGGMCDAMDSVEQFQKALDNYKGLTESQVQENLAYFLRSVVPIAERSGVLMAIHPDDPPIQLFGLPRVVSTPKHVRALLAAHTSNNNGLCMCVASYASRADNDIPAMVEEFAQSINFIHLRNVEKDSKGSFTESDHLTGDVDMFCVLETLLREQARRKSAGRQDYRLPYRPDHGHKMMDDLRNSSPTNPGYTGIGRLRGLAELRGLEMGIIRSGIVDASCHKKRPRDALCDKGRVSKRAATSSDSNPSEDSTEEPSPGSPSSSCEAVNGRQEIA